MKSAHDFMAVPAEPVFQGSVPRSWVWDHFWGWRRDVWSSSYSFLTFSIPLNFIWENQYHLANTSRPNLIHLSLDSHVHRQLFINSFFFILFSSSDNLMSSSPCFSYPLTLLNMSLFCTSLFFPPVVYTHWPHFTIWSADLCSS